MNDLPLPSGSRRRLFIPSRKIVWSSSFSIGPYSMKRRFALSRRVLVSGRIVSATSSEARLWSDAHGPAAAWVSPFHTL